MSEHVLTNSCLFVSQTTGSQLLLAVSFHTLWWTVNPVNPVNPYYLLGKVLAMDIKGQKLRAQPSTLKTVAQIFF